MVRYGGVNLIAGTDELTAAHSIQEALRMYFQQIKNNGRKIDSYTMDYDVEHIVKFNGCLRASLFSCVFPSRPMTPTALYGRSILCSQFDPCPRRPIATPAGLW